MKIIEIDLDKLPRNISLLRQWLNEDRITDEKKLVDELQLIYWITLK